MPQPPGHDPISFSLQCYDAGDLPQAEAICRQILAQQPNHAKALGLLGLIAQRVGRPHVAADFLTRAVAIDPTIPAFHVNLAAALISLGRLDAAIAACHAAIRLKPDSVEAFQNIGQALLAKGNFDDAIAACRTALQFRPDSVVAHNNLGHALRAGGRLDQAIDSLRAALAMHPGVPHIHANLAAAFKDQARLNEAIDSLRVATRLAPDQPRFGSDLLYTLCFHPRIEPTQLFQEYREWAKHHTDGLLDHRPLLNDRDPNRRLRIGYLSPHFRKQVLGLYVEPLLAEHDRSQFEIICYSDVTAPDAVTERMMKHADIWRSVVGLPDADLAELIRADRIDILVDMTNHMGDNRLLVFARKPAPLQITFPHPFTTGMAVMDYIVTDPYLDPINNETESLHSEKLLRMPETYLCYPPTPDSPDVSPLPVTTTGRITFISANNFCKLNDDVLRTWADILDAVPNSRLLVRLDGGAQGSAGISDWFAKHGIDPGRLELIDNLPRMEYLRLFNRADICLDPFPYAGYTTSLDALWMGVPLVTLAGRTSVGRFGVSILSNLGLTDLIARTMEGYVSIAKSLADDPVRLSHLRAGMRERMRKSPLCDSKDITRAIEVEYRRVWQIWAGGGTAAAPVANPAR